MTNQLYFGLLGKIAFMTDQTNSGVSEEDAETAWIDRQAAQVFADAIGCTLEEALEHGDLMKLPEFVMPPEIDTRH